MDMNIIYEEAKAIAEELITTGNLESGELLVVGCSSSEVTAHQIGSFSSKEIGEAIFKGIREAADAHGVYLAAQCCEHLNRALIMEKEAALKYNYERVNVVPQLKAGGSFATAAWAGFTYPVAVEHIAAHAGIDIGDTLIGMHLRHVAVPVRLSRATLGSARVVCARTRLKFIGGVRAIYE